MGGETGRSTGLRTAAKTFRLFTPQEPLLPFGGGEEEEEEEEEEKEEEEGSYVTFEDTSLRERIRFRGHVIRI